MELERQVCSLRLAKRLKELRVKQESLFWWGNYVRTGILPEYNRNKLHYGKYGDAFEPTCAAFTVAELGEMLPRYFQTVRCVGKTLPWQCSHDDLAWHEKHEAIHADIEADARAKMLIYLLEHKLISSAGGHSV